MAINLLFPERCGCGFECVNFKHNLGMDTFSIDITIALKWISEGLVDGKSSLVCCWQATSHHLNQYWQRFPTFYGVTRPQIEFPKWMFMECKIADDESFVADRQYDICWKLDANPYIGIWSRRLISNANYRRNCVYRRSSDTIQNHWMN